MGAGLLYVFSLRIERFCGLLCVFHSRPNIFAVKKRKTQTNPTQTLSTQVICKLVRWCSHDTRTTLQTGTSPSRFFPVHLYLFACYQLIKLNLTSVRYTRSRFSLRYKKDALLMGTQYQCSFPLSDVYI